ncbi:TonB-dependent receptor [Luteibacter pinisoli]|uniref:TonB-dependent receptor n=1 Tax=Luteibacter pinisoli TaxID=2589080 RepID=A0A4Y5Z7C4_9GAMM|nr:TonB-dependent receptor [Luteibacter pinisoli]QDE41117.1 TonB-dependent receptor [Luteibacter pinisoli]
MKPVRLALSIALALSAPAAFADDTDTTPQKATNLGAVDVTAKLDEARNSLSPDTGSSQYVMDRQTIQALPLGDSTPLNQVILQAPGVVQDSYGQLHVRGDHANLQYRIDGVVIPESIGGFGQTLDARVIDNVKLLTGALPAQYGDRTAAVVDITTRMPKQDGIGGTVGITGGQFGTLNPNATLFGHEDKWSFFLTANYLENDVGIENPTASRKPIHDHTNQVKAFGDLSYLINDDTRISFMFGATNNRFEIPNNPAQEPQFGYLDVTNFDSAQLNDRQSEKTRFGILSLQGKLGSTAYQVSAGQRYSGLDFTPDDIGDLMFNGVASNVRRSNRADTVQADFSTPLGDNHTLRYGLYGSFERANSTNDALVFPANDDGSQASTTPLNIVDASRLLARTYALYLQDEWSIGSQWTVNYGVRYDRFDAFKPESQLSPRVGLVYQPTDSTTIHAGYSRYFTPPATESISPTSIAKFVGTTNALPDNGSDTPLSERSSYYDIGISQKLGDQWTVGLDSYRRNVNRLQDEGQFGTALVYSTFNYGVGKIKGDELTVNYDGGALTAYFNFAYNRAVGKRVITGQYNFAPDDLAYIYDHFIHLDHDQKYTASGGVSYAFGEGTRVGADYLFGSGLRSDGIVPNGDHLPAYFQLNFSVSQDMHLTSIGATHAQLALVNALDRTYEIRDGSGIGVGAPQFGPRRGLFLSLQQDF